MKSRHPRSIDLSFLSRLFNCRTPGSLGTNDYADPFFLLKDIGCRLIGDTPGPLGLNDHADPFHQLHKRIPPAKKPLPTPKTGSEAKAPAATGPLQVSAGQVTFDAEGNDLPKSPYYSRLITWPGGKSGVTIGRGYDMGWRNEADVTADLMAAGLSQDKAKEFAKGAHKRGLDAKKFVDANRESLGEITQQVQKQLFENIYPTYIPLAKTNYDYWTVDPQGKALSGKVEWEKLKPVVRDILVDFVYNGWTKGPNPMVKGMKNDPDELITYIQTNADLSGQEKGRQRVAYLKARKNM